jgi:hypothetical protein
LIRIDEQGSLMNVYERLARLEDELRSGDLDTASAADTIGQLLEHLRGYRQLLDRFVAETDFVIDSEQADTGRP